MNIVKHNVNLRYMYVRNTFISYIVIAIRFNRLFDRKMLTELLFESRTKIISNCERIQLCFLAFTGKKNIFLIEFLIYFNFLK